MSAHHKHTNGPEHDHEPQRGLPEALPADERLIWQGSPDWRSLARHAFHLRKLTVYFALLLALRVVLDIADGTATAELLKGAAWFVAFAGIGLALVAVLARLSATQAVYTITSRRVVMRIGIVLMVTYNLPFRQVEGAGLHLKRDGSGDIPLQLVGDQRIAYLRLWPHARPWQLRRTQPMLRCVPDAQRVAKLLSEAWQASPGHGEGLVARGSTLQPEGERALAGTALRPVKVPVAARVASATACAAAAAEGQGALPGHAQPAS
jgi:hypothetical protein